MDAIAYELEDMKKQRYTVDDILALPEGERAELINGVKYDMASPTPSHQRISMGLSAALYNHFQKNKGDCEVYPAPFAVFAKQDARNYFEPDISVICDKSKLSDCGCEGAPDLIIEIASESTEKRDYMLKFTKYQEIGVKEYWIVNPMRGETSVYWFAGDIDEPETIMYGFDEEVAFHLYPELKVRIMDYVE